MLAQQLLLPASQQGLILPVTSLGVEAHLAIELLVGLGVLTLLIGPHEFANVLAHRAIVARLDPIGQI